ncbi:MAG: fatty acid desaturase [Phycisphaera sp.]|nr:fatty acid desaturase [Phycisphaera sp.]
MLERSALIRATLPFAHEQRARSWWHLWSTLTLLVAAVALAAAPLPVPLRLIGSVLAGLMQCRMFIIYHDYQHGAILKKSKLATALMTGYGILTLNPPSTWNDSHNHHHKHNAKIRGASIGSFPVMTVAAWQQASRGERFMYAISRHPITIFFAWFTVFLYSMTIKSLLRKPSQHLDCAVAVVLHIGLWVVLAVFAPLAMVYAFIIPCMLASILGAYLFYAQHSFPDVDLCEKSEWNYCYAALKSSSFLDTTRIMHYFTGNIGYHHVHHLNAKIPFYRLPETMAALPELQSPGITRLNPLAIRACFRLKLWDETQRKMVGFNSAVPAGA